MDFTDRQTAILTRQAGFGYKHSLAWVFGSSSTAGATDKLIFQAEQMILYGLNREQFQAMYRRKLDGLSKHVIAYFSTLLSVPVAPDVDEAHVEIFPGEDGASPDVWLYWRGKNNKVDHADLSLFAGRSMRLELGLEILAELDEQYFVDPDQFPGLELAIPILSHWVAECWWKAGGWRYPVPVTLTVHDFGNYGSVLLSEGSS